MATPNNLTLLCTRILEARANYANQHAIKPTRIDLVDIYQKDSTTRFTKAQLDMRRKAEILKYAPNRMSTQTNSFTKKEKYAYMANGRKNPDSSNLPACPNDKDIRIPTSSSDVPGPVQYLYEETDLPLYNLSTNIRSYPFSEKELEKTLWINDYDENVLVTSNTSTAFCRIIVAKTIDRPIYSFRIQTHLGIYVKGITGTSWNNSNINPFSVSLLKLYIEIYYIDTRIQTINIDVSTFAKLIFDVQGSQISTAFSLGQYSGSIDLTNLLLYTEPTYYYDFKVYGILSINGGANEYTKYMEAFIVANLSSNSNFLEIKNCRKLSNQILPPHTNGAPSISGVAK